MNNNVLLSEGKILPIMEEFYSLQGEGNNTGKAAYFIRIGGCDVGCDWCDVKESWDASIHPLTVVDEVVARANLYKGKAVVVTGGEPALYNLNYLTNELKKKGIETFIETSGSVEITGVWDWICVSPKMNLSPTKKSLLIANELKIIISNSADFDWAEINSKLVNPNCILYLQPEWSKIDKIMPQIIDYILENPKWRISIQSHKYMHIP